MKNEKKFKLVIIKILSTKPKYLGLVERYFNAFSQLILPGS